VRREVYGLQITDYRLKIKDYYSLFTYKIKKARTMVFSTSALALNNLDQTEPLIPE
jgi:hypothetical protein